MKSIRYIIEAGWLWLLCMTISFQVNGQIGKVGINTLTPQAMLHVKDSAVLFTANAIPPALPGPTPVLGSGSRMMWYSQKAAFRAGTVYAAQWDRENIGTYSLAAGLNTVASGSASVAFGDGTTSSGYASVAFGLGNVSSGYGSIAAGLNSQATNDQSIAFGTSTFATGQYTISLGANCVSSGTAAVTLGSQNTASGFYSMAFGSNTIASGNYGLSTGFSSKASGDRSIAMGGLTTASGFNSTALGWSTKAKGDISTSMGFQTIAKPYLAVAIGQYNDTTSFSPSVWDPVDPVFIIGSGTANNARKNIFTVLKSGKTGINISYPTAMLHVQDSSVLFAASVSLPANPGGPPANGSGRRMMWYADKAAFRTGISLGDEWDKVNTGNYSVAGGFGTKASGSASVAFGDFTTASGDRATAFGSSTTASGGRSMATGNGTTASNEAAVAFGTNSIASGITSTAFGSGTIASGTYATSTGNLTVASGNISTAMGINATAKAYASLVIGRYNDTTALSSTTWNLLDPVFVVGNGANNSNRSNALTILKMGRVGIGTATPKTQMQITNGVEADNTPNSGYLLIGETTSANIVFDDNEIQGRSNGSYAELNIQPHGGSLYLCETSGNVGIGVSSPGYKLDVGARMRLRGGGSISNSAGAWFNKINNSTTASFLGMFSDDYLGVYGDLGAGWSMVVGTSSGNVGIGTTNPAQRLVVSNNQSNDGGWTKGIVIENTGTNGEAAVSFKNTVMPASKQWNVGLNETPNLAFGYQAGFLNSGIRMVIDTFGNVGVGITAPTQRLHVVGNGLFTGTVTASCGVLSCSDIRYKTRLSPISNALSSVLQLHGIYYYWDKEKWKDLHFDDRRQIGFSAQEVEKYFPEMVYTDETGYKSVDYSRMTPVLLEAIKSQQEQIAAQQKTNNEQQQQIDFLMNELRTLKSQWTSTMETASKN